MKNKKSSIFKNLVIGPMKISKKEWNFIKKTSWSQLTLIDGGDHYLDQLKKSLNSSTYLNKVHLGDGDSSKKPPSVLKRNENLSDLAFYLKKSQKVNGQICTYFFGFIGGELDHLLFNFGSWVSSIDEKVKRTSSKNNRAQFPLFVVGNDIMIFKQGEYQLNLKGRFSLLAIKPCAIKLDGNCQYTIKKWAILKPLDSLTLGNFGFGEVTLTTKGSLILYSKNLILEKVVT